MQYIDLGKTGYRVSRLGFGAMRLPMTRIGDKDFVDVERALALFHRAFELGVNYVDTGFMYCNYESEFVVGPSFTCPTPATCGACWSISCGSSDETTLTFTAFTASAGITGMR